MTRVLLEERWGGRRTRVPDNTPRCDICASPGPVSRLTEDDRAAHYRMTGRHLAGWIRDVCPRCARAATRRATERGLTWTSI